MASKSRRRSDLILLALGILAIALLALNFVYRERLQRHADEVAGQGAGSVIGHHRPEFNFPDRLGLSHSIGEWDGQILVVNFWATWCEPCVREIPAFVDLQRDYGDRGVRFLGVSFDKLPEVNAFVKKLGVDLNYPVLIGGEDAIGVASHYGDDVGVLPYTVIVDRDGKVVFAQFGELTRDQTEQMLLRLL